MVTVSLDDQIRCVRRELALRKNVYPKWVASGRMHQADADRELAAMQAVHDTVTACVWQPISVAPHDGTWVLLDSPDASDGPFIGQWRYNPEFPDQGAWWGDDDNGFPIDADPTRWMPRPARAPGCGAA